MLRQKKETAEVDCEKFLLLLALRRLRFSVSFVEDFECLCSITLRFVKLNTVSISSLLSFQCLSRNCT